MPMKILRMADGDGGGGANGNTGGGGTSWLASLPEDLRGNPSLKDVPDVATLAKRFVDTKALVGAEKIAKPNAKWTDKEWSDWYAAGGRPESADKYEAFKEGLEEQDELHGTLSEVRKFAHELGLNPQQAKLLQAKYAGLSLEGRKIDSEAKAKARSEAESAIKKDWGDKYDGNLATAKKAVEFFGGADLLKFLDDSQLGNHPQFIRAMYKIGMSMMDDSALAARSGFKVSDADSAKREINELRNDKDFMSRRDRGDREARERFDRLYKIAYPTS